MNTIFQPDLKLFGQRLLLLSSYFTQSVSTPSERNQMRQSDTCYRTSLGNADEDTLLFQPHLAPFAGADLSNSLPPLVLPPSSTAQPRRKQSACGLNSARKQIGGDSHRYYRRGAFRLRNYLLPASKLLALSSPQQPRGQRVHFSPSLPPFTFLCEANFEPHQHHYFPSTIPSAEC